MSKIEITSSNLDKFVKRFHKVSDAKNNGKKLSESQETFAQSLGCSNYNELKKLLESETVKEDVKKSSSIGNSEYKGFFIKDIDVITFNEFLKKVRELSTNSEMKKVEIFYAKLITLIHHRYSKLSSCIFEKDGFEYSLTFRTCYGDKFCYIFGKKSDYLVLSTALKSAGLSDIDVMILEQLLNNSSTNEFFLESRFQAIDFANDLYNYLCEIRGEKKLYVLKFNENDTINKSYVYKHDLLYTKETKYIKTPELKELSGVLLDHKDSEYFYIKSRSILNSWNYGSEPFYYLESLSNDDIIVKKEDINKIKMER
jgi:hypothetical protein